MGGDAPPNSFRLLQTITGALPASATMSPILLGIATLHGLNSIILRPSCRRKRPPMAQNRAMAAVGVIVALLAVVGSRGQQDLGFLARFLPFTIELGHAISVYQHPIAGRFQAVMDGLVASVLLIILAISRHMNVHVSIFTSRLFILDVVPPLLLLLALLCVPRASDEFSQGRPVDRQHSASLLELLTFSWPRRIFQPQNLQGEKIESLARLAPALRAESLAQHQQRRIRRQLASHSLGFILAKEYIGPLVLQWSLAILYSFAVIAPELVKYRLLQWLGGERDQGRSLSDGLMLALLFGLSKGAPVFIESWLQWVTCSMIELPMQSTMALLVYQKALSSPSAATDKPNDEGAAPPNQMSMLRMHGVSGHACGVFNNTHGFVSSLTQLISTAVILTNLVGWQCMAVGVLTSLVIMPLTTVGMKHWGTLLSRKWRLGSDRKDVLQDALLVIRHIKISAAELPWKQRIYDIRENELQQSRSVAWLMFFLVIVGNISPTLLSGVPIYIFAWQGNPLTASLAFTFISLFKALQSKMFSIPQQLPRIRSAWGSLKTLEALLKREEMDTSHIMPSDILALKDVSITWPNNETSEKMFKLQGLQAEFPTGGLSIVTGKTGSGKSLLLSALVGEANVFSGHICRPEQSIQEDFEHTDQWLLPGRMALVTQSPWMANMTIQDNILFGLPMHPERYALVLHACALEKDLAMFKDGDATVIAIKGVTLSGGQRSRIALARALYSRATILLMDDILSAVDAEVREWIVDKALCGSLARGRTRVLVTHHEAQVLSKASFRLRIHDQTAQGELLPLSTTETVEGIGGRNDSLSDNCRSANSKESKKQNSRPSEEEKPPHKTDPDQVPDRYSWLNRYKIYFHAAGGTPSWLLTLIAVVACEYASICASQSLKNWVTQDDSALAPDARQYFMSRGALYFLLSTVKLLSVSVRGSAWFRLEIKAAKTLFASMTNHLFGARLQWLESTSHGEIMRSFGPDMRLVDERVIHDLGYVIDSIAGLGTILFTSASFSLVEMPLVCGLFYLFFVSGRHLLSVTKHLEAIESTAGSAYSQHLSSLQAPDGILTVRAYGKDGYFVQQANKMTDNKASASWHKTLYSVMMKLYLGTLGVVYVTLVCCVMVLSGTDAGTAGIALSFAVTLSSTVTGAVQRFATVDSELKMVEKIAAFSEIEQEPTSGIDVSDSWPENGQLEARGFSAGYGPDLPPTLHGISFVIRPGERVGVVGRTGAGKSTLALSFAQLLHNREGALVIDSVEIATIKPDVLRKRILVIPQDPYLFAGTLRSAIDPSNAHTDEELIASLERFRFFSTTANGSGSEKQSDNITDLEFRISDGGSNLSQGQRQILCLVKAMLWRKKVVIMDEATSAVDMETDAAIQTAIRDGLRDATVLIIAHRLATVANLDKVLVMQDGTVAEFGTPGELYRNKGTFWTLVNHSVDREDLVKSFEHRDNK